jgi:LemA protein
MVKNMAYFGWALLIIVVVAIFWLIGVYNSLIKMRNRTDEAWSDIDVQLKRRYNLIPNLVETVKGYAKHEKEVFEKVTEARSRAMGAKSVKDQGEAENMLAGALKSLFAVVENYPELKANQNFLELQRELTDTEDKIQAARRFYNGNVRDFNVMMQTFPNNFAASMFGFKAREFFEIEEPEAREPVAVKF